MTDGPFYGNQHTLDEELSYDYDDMKRDVKLLAEEIGRPPTTRDAEGDDRLPSIKKMYRLLGERSWNDLLDEADLGQTQVGACGRDERKNILDDMRRVFQMSDTPYVTLREYVEHGTYNKSVVKRLFGSWTDACKAAEIPHGRKHGVRCEGPRGEILESRVELQVAQELDARGLAYDPHRTIPDTRWRCDFHLTDESLWIEVDGYIRGQRPNRDSFEEKLRHYEREQMEYVVVNGPQDLEKKVFHRS